MRYFAKLKAGRQIKKYKYETNITIMHSTGIFFKGTRNHIDQKNSTRKKISYMVVNKR